MTERQGDTCPGCGQPAMDFGGLGEFMAQRFCPNGTCHVFSWDPEMTLDELAADMQVVDLPDLPSSDGQDGTSGA